MKQFVEIKTLHANLDVAIRNLGNAAITQLGPITLRDPPGDSAAFRFYHGVSWLYVSVIEVGGVSFRFMVTRARALGIDGDEDSNAFIRDVGALRTLFQHNLDPSNRHDAATLANASRWMFSAAGREQTIGEDFWPSKAGEWQCIEAFLNESAHSFLVQMLDVVDHIRKDESKDAIIEEWAQRCSRGLPPHVFDQLVEQGMGRLGLPFLDPVRVRSFHYDKWNATLRLLSEAADLQLEAQRLVDGSLLDEWKNYCPIDGDDVIRRLGVPPGPKVGEILARARSIWQQSPCSREELLLRVSDKTVL